jgi:hypothetical protein
MKTIAICLFALLAFVADASAFGRRNNQVIVNTPGSQVVVNQNRGFFGGSQRTFVNVNRGFSPGFSPGFAPSFAPVCAPRTTVFTPGAFIQVR